MRVLAPSLTIAVSAASGAPAGAAEKRRLEAEADTPLPAEKMQVYGSSMSQTVPPKFISGAAPIYPITSVQRGEPGVAVISFEVDERGRTGDFRVQKTNYRFFASHAIAAVQKWRYRPAMKAGRPVRYRIRIPFSYQISG